MIDTKDNNYDSNNNNNNNNKPTDRREAEREGGREGGRRKRSREEKQEGGGRRKEEGGGEGGRRRKEEGGRRKEEEKEGGGGRRKGRRKELLLPFSVSLLGCPCQRSREVCLLLWRGAPALTRGPMGPLTCRSRRRRGWPCWVAYMFTVGLGLGRQRIQCVARLERPLETKRGHNAQPLELVRCFTRLKLVFQYGLLCWMCCLSCQGSP